MDETEDEEETDEEMDEEESEKSTSKFHELPVQIAILSHRYTGSASETACNPHLLWMPGTEVGETADVSHDNKCESSGNTGQVDTDATKEKLCKRKEILRDLEGQKQQAKIEAERRRREEYNKHQRPESNSQTIPKLARSRFLIRLSR